MFGRLVGQGIGDQRLQVLVEDFMLLVRQLLEAGKGSVQLVAFQCDAQLLRRERNAARPECLPITILLAFQPTDWADMIS